MNEKYVETATEKSECIRVALAAGKTEKEAKLLCASCSNAPLYAVKPTVISEDKKKSIEAFKELGRREILESVGVQTKEDLQLKRCLNMLEVFGVTGSDKYSIANTVCLSSEVCDIEGAAELRQLLKSGADDVAVIKSMARFIVNRNQYLKQKEADAAKNKFYFSEETVNREMQNINKWLMKENAASFNNPVETEQTYIPTVKLREAAIRSLTFKAKNTGSHTDRLTVKTSFDKTREQLIDEYLIQWHKKHPNGLSEVDE